MKSAAREDDLDVSTHSRPKAAAFADRLNYFRECSFNTQPPEGGCRCYSPFEHVSACFNTQPPEGGCLGGKINQVRQIEFQHTAARRRLLPT